MFCTSFPVLDGRQEEVLIRPLPQSKLSVPLRQPLLQGPFRSLPKLGSRNSQAMWNFNAFVQFGISRQQEDANAVLLA